MKLQKMITGCICIAAMLLLSGCTSDERQRNGEPSTPPVDERLQETEIMPTNFRYEAGASAIFQTLESPDRIADDLTHESVIGYVYIQFSEQRWRPDLMDAGDTMMLYLPGDLKPVAEIRRKRTIGDLVSITADLLEPNHGMVSLTHEKNRIVGTIELYSEKRTFHIRYDRHNDMIYLAEVDPAKLDVLEGSPPLIPPLHDEPQIN